MICRSARISSGALFATSVNASPDAPMSGPTGSPERLAQRRTGLDQLPAVAGQEAVELACVVPSADDWLVVSSVVVSSDVVSSVACPCRARLVVAAPAAGARGKQEDNSDRQHAHRPPLVVAPPLAGGDPSSRNAVCRGRDSNPHAPTGDTRF